MYHIKDDKRSKRSARFIYLALDSLLDEKNYDKISITEVIQRSEVGRATFYRNFDSLDDVLKYECDRKFIELKTSVQSKNKNSSNKSKSHPLTLILPFLEYWYQDSRIIELLLISNNRNILINNIEQIVMELDKISFIENENPILSYAVNLRTYIIASIILTWITNKKNITPRDLHKQLTIHFDQTIMINNKHE
ncbi:MULTISPECIES: TetR/AcrR family transcriptional regulator [unclassified Fusibacter]|uniref:TetR/AcrR family transcriptional regulator n=1 Tax=unclassified Fusibacter TaxID=2624464 RepID=UPI0013E93BCF|nr:MULTISPECIES: TetR/AcrR family transcriptional regulator [unclassified Fusibacter]MCK8061579.1 TetR/AcrR family transcriptional regulator [Fusibacter sp. A2]NPE23903.1 TetR/AcrR family transcriptional regulator [Fusibacter sp. A1]